MLRPVSMFALVAGMLTLSAYRAAEPRLGEQPFPVNTTVARFFLSGERQFASFFEDEQTTEPDTVLDMRILMMNYSAYDNVYPEKARQIIQKNFPMSSVSEFWEGSLSDFAAQLAASDAVVASYPAGGNTENLKLYGKELSKFIRRGGMVIFTGTDQYTILQDFGLLDIDFGYFCKSPGVHLSTPEHPVLAGTSEDFSMQNYAYPLDISDPAFVSLADVKGYPVMGYKPLGKGYIVYLGFEYYFDEREPTQMLLNALHWSMQDKLPVVEKEPDTESSGTTALVLKHTEEILYAGTGSSKNDQFDLHIYPNPYVSKATLDIELKKGTTLSVEMVDENGRLAALLLPRKNLGSGFYRFELPNVAPGTYLVQCKTSETTITRRVVKTAAN